MAINLNQFQQINPLNNLPTAESAVIGGVERKVLSYLFPDGNGAPRKGVGAVNRNFDVNNFIQNLGNHNETARADKFDVQFNCPAGLLPQVTFDQRALSLQCEISELPGRDVQMLEYRLHQFTQRIPHMNQYGAANFTFVVTGDMWEKKFFDAWMDIMLPAATGLAEYPENESHQNNYEADLFCNQYDSIGQKAYSVKLWDAIPVNMSPLNQAWDNDAIHRLSVSFAFRKWSTVQLDNLVHPVTPQGPGGAASAIGPPGIISTLNGILSQTIDQRVAGLAVAGVGAQALSKII